MEEETKPKQPMKCVKCLKYINDKEDYIEVKEYQRGELIKVNYMHKKCWGETMDSKAKVGQAMGVLKVVTKKFGLEPEEEVVIK